jgi:hypothetical protein
MNYEDNFNDGDFQGGENFAIKFGGQSSAGNRSLISGTYQAEVKNIKKKVATGKYAGEGQLEWRMRIIEGPLSKLEFVMTTLLGPTGEGGMSWTTDRVISSIFPSLQEDQEVTLNDLVGGKIQVTFETQTNSKTGQLSMYVQTKYIGPYVPPGSTGSLGDMS